MDENHGCNSWMHQYAWSWSCTTRNCWAAVAKGTKKKSKNRNRNKALEHKQTRQNCLNRSCVHVFTITNTYMMELLWEYSLWYSARFMHKLYLHRAWIGLKRLSFIHVFGLWKETCKLNRERPPQSIPRVKARFVLLRGNSANQLHNMSARSRNLSAYLLLQVCWTLEEADALG